MRFLALLQKKYPLVPREIIAKTKKIPKETLDFIDRYINEIEGANRPVIEKYAKTIPDEYRKVNKILYRGMAITERDRTRLLKTGFTLNSASSWTFSKKIAEQFTSGSGGESDFFEYDYESARAVEPLYGVIFSYKPKLNEVIINVQSIRDLLDSVEHYSEEEVILQPLTLTKKNIVKIFAL